MERFTPDQPTGDDRLIAVLEKLATAVASPPTVTVSAPSVSVAAPAVNVEQPATPTKWTFKIVRDPATQRITEIIANGR